MVSAGGAIDGFDDFDVSGLSLNDLASSLLLLEVKSQ